VIKIVDDKTYVQVEEQQPRREELVVPETSKRKKLKTLTEKEKHMKYIYMYNCEPNCKQISFCKSSFSIEHHTEH
jgi:hypothetical protein